jgi:hypothetical protein
MIVPNLLSTSETFQLTEVPTARTPYFGCISAALCPMLSSLLALTDDDDDDVYLGKNYNTWVTKSTLCIVSRINTQNQSSKDMNTDKTTADPMMMMFT